MTPSKYLQCYHPLAADFEITDIVKDIGFKNVSTKSDVTRSVICLIFPFSIPQIKRSIRLVGQIT